MKTQGYKYCQNTIQFQCLVPDIKTINGLQENMDGWLFYAQPFQDQKKLVEAWHSGTDRFKPFMNILMIDLSQNPNETVNRLKVVSVLDVKFITNIKSL